jgi:hypothetical protein
MIGLRRFGPLLAVGLLLAAAAVAAMLATPQIRRAPFTPPSLPPVLPPTPAGSGAPSQLPPRQIPQTDPARDVQLPGWLLLAAQLFCVLIVAAAIAVLLWYLLQNGLRMRERRQELFPAPPVQTRDEVLAAVDAGLSDLDDTDADPRRAVIACWVRLEQAAAAAGTPRERGDTPTELVTRLFSEHDVSAPVLYALAEVYRLARYATHAVDATMRDQARAALQQVRGELSRERQAVP